jgi:hypothetical protein
MGLEGFREREHGIADLVMLLAIVFLAVLAWSCLSDAAIVPLWKLYISIAVSWVLALATLTRRLDWSASIRFLTGGWIIAAPYLLNFSNMPQERWAYLAIGMTITIISIPGVAALVAPPALLAARRREGLPAIGVWPTDTRAEGGY